MTKIYITLRGDYDKEIIGAFSSYENALGFVSLLKENPVSYDNQITIQEWELDSYSVNSGQVEKRHIVSETTIFDISKHLDKST